jgi:hypothetical protein
MQAVLVAVKLAYVYIYRRGTSTRFKIGKALDVDSRTKRSLRNVEPEYEEFDRIEVDADFVYKCETYLHNRLASRRVSGTREVFDLDSADEMRALITECRTYFEEYIPIQRRVDEIGKQSETTWLPAGPEEQKLVAQLGKETERQLESSWQIEIMQNRLKLRIGNRAGIDGLISWQTNEPGDCFDLERFRTEHPDLFDEYQKPRTLSRPFKLILVGD